MLMDSYMYIFHLVQTYSLFISFIKESLNTAIHRMGNAQIFCVLDVKNKKSFNPNLHFTACFPKISI